MAKFTDKQIPAHQRDPDDEPPSTQVHVDTVHPQDLTPTAPAEAKVDAEGIIHIGAGAK